MAVKNMTLQRLRVAADKAAAGAEVAKQQVRSAKAALKHARKVSKAAKKVAKLARKKAEAARLASVPAAKSTAAGAKRATTGGKTHAKNLQSASQVAKAVISRMSAVRRSKFVVEPTVAESAREPVERAGPVD